MVLFTSRSGHLIKLSCLLLPFQWEFKMFWAMSSRESSSWWFNERIHFSPITMSLEVGSPDLKKQLQDVIKSRFFLYLYSILSIVASHIVVDGTMAVTSSCIAFMFMAGRRWQGWLQLHLSFVLLREAISFTEFLLADFRIYPTG